MKLIFSFALPLLLGNLLQQTYNIIDSAIVGRVLGANALAAVGASSSVQFLVLGFCTGICCGFGIPLAKYFGAGDRDKMRCCIFNSALLTAGAAVIITTVCAVFCTAILHMLSTPDNIFGDAYSYLLIIFLGIPFTLLYNLLACILRAVGDSRTPFIFLGISSVLNIFLDLLFIVVFRMGCAGAAAATVTAQAVSGVLCFIYIKKHFPELALSPQDRQANGKMIWQLITMGVPMGLQYSITAIGSMVMQSANNSLGSVYISGFTAGMRIKQFAMCPFDAIATAVSVFCGQNLGAGKPERAAQTLKYAAMIATGYGIAVVLVLELVAEPLLGCFTTDAAVVLMGCQYIRGYIVDTIFAGIHFSFTGYFAACGKSYIGFLHNIIAIVLVRVPGSYLASRLFAGTLLPMGLAAPAGSLLSVIICVAAYRWMKRRGTLYTAA